MFTGVISGNHDVQRRGELILFDLNRSATFARNAAAELPMGGNVKAIELRQWM